MAEKHADTRDSVMSALGNVAPYTLCDSGLTKRSGDRPVFSTADPEPGLS
jgi:hypothetical protein